jgi:hypothetical protein
MNRSEIANHVLLLGAGFSRNWGGLATEAFEYLLGHPKVDESLRQLLWKHRRREDRTLRCGSTEVAYQNTCRDRKLAIGVKHCHYRSSLYTKN